MSGIARRRNRVEFPQRPPRIYLHRRPRAFTGGDLTLYRPTLSEFDRRTTLSSRFRPNARSSRCAATPTTGAGRFRGFVLESPAER